MLEFLPEKIKEALRYVNIRRVYEIRLRANKPTTVNFNGSYVYLGGYGLTEKKEKAIYCDILDISDTIFRAGNYSVYSVEEQIRQGFLTAEHGERIGLAGEYVLEKGKVHALKHFTSLCIRVPHEVIGSGEEVYNICMSDTVCNLLLISSPGLGKTTILRDLSRILGVKKKKNILICDERGEISSENVGESSDVIKFCDKERAFEAGIRAMRPDILITDELSLADIPSIKRAIKAGVYVLASAHFSTFEAVNKEFLELFEHFVLLDNQEIGKIKGIYDKTGRDIYNGC